MQDKEFQKMFLIYSIAYVIALIVLFPFEFMKRPANVRGRWLKEKLGWGGKTEGPRTPAIWIHAVSVGEVAASVPFVKRLKELYPEAGITVSTITDTGQKVAHERLSGDARIIYLPFDIPFVIRKALKTVRPSLFINMETELWPNLFRSLKGNGIPVIIMNGRVSESSFSGYRKIGFFMKRVLGCVGLFCMQEPVYAKRIIELGADAGKVTVTGNFKFDIKPPSRPQPWTEGLAGLVIVAGSTHRGEEELIAKNYIRLREDFPSLCLIIAPRHPERAKEVSAALREMNVDSIMRSGIKEGNAGNRVVVLDTVGELSSVYGKADIAVIGGSFIEHGGQNPLEPSCWGKPVVTGPHMENFPFIEEFYAEGAALKTDGEGLYGALKGLLESEEKRLGMGGIARRLYEKNSGAVERTINLISGLLVRYGNL
jgi:3-deoxy-D-manno-octulosonic-acid transferase